MIFKETQTPTKYRESSISAQLNTSHTCHI